MYKSKWEMLDFSFILTSKNSEELKTSFRLSHGSWESSWEKENAAESQTI